MKLAQHQSEIPKTEVAYPLNSTSVGRADKLLCVNGGAHLFCFVHHLLQTDVIVAGCGSDMGLSSDGVAAALSQKAGPALQSECNQLPKLQAGQVQQATGHNLRCKFVFLCNCVKTSNQSAQEVRQPSLGAKHCQLLLLLCRSVVIIIAEDSVQGYGVCQSI